MNCLEGRAVVFIAKGLLLLLISCTVALSAYGIYKLWMKRREKFIIKRSEWIKHEIAGSNLAVTLALLSTIVVIPATCFSRRHTDLLNHTQSLLCWFTITLCLNVKYFLFLLRGKKHQFAVRTEWRTAWQRMIDQSRAELSQLNNPDSAKVEENWYIRNQHRFNTLPSTYAYFGCFHFTLFILCESSYIYCHHLRGANGLDFIRFFTFKSVESLLFLTPFLFMLLIAKLIPNPEDPHCIHWERQTTLKLVAFWCVLQLSANWTNSIPFFFQSRPLIGDPVVPVIESLIFTTLTILVLFGIVFTSTYGLIRRNNADDKQLMLQGHSSGRWDPDNDDKVNVRNITLDMVLSNFEALDLLMRHLEREYSMEVLLSYIELDQFQKYVMEIADEFLKTHLLGPQRTLSAATPSPGTPSQTLPGLPGLPPIPRLTLKLGVIPETTADGMHMSPMRTDTMPLTPPTFSDIFTKSTKTPHKEGTQQTEPGMRYSDLQCIANLDLNVMRTMTGIPASQILSQMCSISTSRGITPDQKTMHDIKNKAHLLYNKYVKCGGSPFEVNISCDMRSMLRDKLEDKDKLMKDETIRLAELIQMFDGVKLTMKQLLRSPFGRMKFGPEKDKLMAIFGIKTKTPKDVTIKIPMIRVPTKEAEESPNE